MLRSTVSGERFFVTYQLAGEEKEAHAQARYICLEQTVVLPEELLQDGVVKDHVTGRVEEFGPHEQAGFKARISFAIENVAGELPQLLNVIGGSISMQPGIRVIGLELPESLLKKFKGPRFGRSGIRELLKVPRRPLLCVSLRPLGLPAPDLADIAFKCALGGVDVVMDDHHLANQPFAPFYDRVHACADAVNRANQRSGYNCIYVPNVTAPDNDMLQRIRTAKSYGSRGLLISPGISGFDTVRKIADDSSISMPLFSHAAFLGAFMASPTHGISHGVLLGQLMRLAGVDATLFPNFGTYAMTTAECQDILRGSLAPMSHVRQILPCPVGNMSGERFPGMMEVYGNDVIFIIGKDLFSRGPNLTDNCKYFRSLVDPLS